MPFRLFWENKCLKYNFEHAKVKYRQLFTKIKMMCLKFQIKSLVDLDTY